MFSSDDEKKEGSPSVATPVAAPPRKYIELTRYKAGITSRRGLIPARVVHHPTATHPPSNTTLEKYFPAVPYDQAQEGSSTSNAIAHYLKALDPNRNGPLAFEPSRQFIYTKELLKENPGLSPLQDLGANAADGLTIIHDIGVPPDADFPYPVDPVTQKVTNFGQLPSETALANAAAHKYPQGSDVTNSGPMLGTIQTLIDQNTPVLLACTIYPSFESDSMAMTGIMPMPSRAEVEGKAKGGQQFLIGGYIPGYLRVCNSWGPNWGNAGGPAGNRGWFNMPNEYLIGAGADGQFVGQLLTIAPIPDAAPPVPPPPAVGSAEAARAALAALRSQLVSLNTQLGLSQPPPLNVPHIRQRIAVMEAQLGALDALLSTLP